MARHCSAAPAGGWHAQIAEEVRDADGSVLWQTDADWSRPAYRIGARDGYVSPKALSEIERRFQPSKSPDNPNVVLKVPCQPWILSQGSVAPPAVVAADLLAHSDGRVVRTGGKLLHSIASR